MLVLSRRQNEKIVFPRLGITMEVLRIGGKTVRIGVDAPQDVAVMRHEVLEREGTTDITRERSATAPLAVQAAHQVTQQHRISQHELRNRLNAAQLAVQLGRKQLELGMSDLAEQTLERALHAFSELEAELARQGNPSPSSRPSEATARGRARALLVEDDANECELLAGYLRLSGFEVDTAYDGVEALDYLNRAGPPDVVLLDMAMPRRNGSETITEIRSNPDLRGLKVFAVSGSAPADYGISMGPNGVDGWFSKPLNPAQLVQALSGNVIVTATD